MDDSDLQKSFFEDLSNLYEDTKTSFKIAQENSHSGAYNRSIKEVKVFEIQKEAFSYLNVSPPGPLPFI